MNTTIRTILIVVAVIVLIILANLAWNEHESTATPSTATSTAATSTTNLIINPASSTQEVGGYTITEVPVGSASGVKESDYKAALVFSGVPADQQAALQTQFNAAVAAITADPGNMNNWIQLGDVRKEAGDYQGAATDWTYVSEAAPSNIISFANLGDLYTNFLPDYPLAVQNFKQEIKNDPQDPYIYDDLYQIYNDQDPQPKATIVAMLQAGLTANPGNSTLEADLSVEESK